MGMRKVSCFLVVALLGTTSLTAMAAACSVHDHGCRFHGASGPNLTGVPATSGGSLNFTTTWTPNSQGEIPDLDTHVLLQEDAGPYVVDNGQSPIGVNTPYRPWPYGSAEFERNVYYVQPDIAYNNGQARAQYSGDIGTANPTGHCALTGSGTCEEIRITGNLPAGEVRQITYRPIAAPNAPANPSGEGSTYLTQIWSTPGYVIDKVTVGGEEIFPDHRGIYRAGEGRSLLNDTERSPEIVVSGHAVSAHATGVQLAQTRSALDMKNINNIINGRRLEIALKNSNRIDDHLIRINDKIMILIDNNINNIYDNVYHDILSISTDDIMQDITKKRTKKLYPLIKFSSFYMDLHDAMVYAKRLGNSIANEDPINIVSNSLHMAGQYFGAVDTAADVFDTAYKIKENFNRNNSKIYSLSKSAEDINDFFTNGYFSVAMEDYNNAIDELAYKINKDGFNKYTLLISAYTITTESFKATSKMIYGAGLRFYNTIPPSQLKGPVRIGIKRGLKVLDTKSSKAIRYIKENINKGKQSSIKLISATKSMYKNTSKVTFQMAKTAGKKILRATGKMVEATEKKVNGTFDSTVKWLSNLKIR